METRINAGANATFTPEQVTRKMLIEKYKTVLAKYKKKLNEEKNKKIK